MIVLFFFFKDEKILQKPCFLPIKNSKIYCFLYEKKAFNINIVLNFKYDLKNYFKLVLS